jgi:hypothetical protein
VVTSVFLAFSCGARTDQADSQADWQHVLSRKKAAASPTASSREKQIYADTLGAFLQKHPTHGRARLVYRRIQLDFASELASLGRYQDAIGFYKAVLAHDPGNEEANRGVAEALDRLAVTKAKLLALEKGMTQHQVSQLLGKPVPGWKVRNDRRDTVIESWYYRTVDGGVAGVYFRGGVLFAAEPASNEKLASLTR